MWDELVRRTTLLERKTGDLNLPEKPMLLAAPFLQLPMLRGLWVASVNSAGAWFSLSGLAKTLTYQGNPTVNYDGLAPYWDYDGVGDYHNRTDEADLDITGTESYVASGASGIQGLTFGGWFWFDNAATGNERCMGKWNTVGGANERSYLLYRPVGGQATVAISSDGTAVGISATASTNVVDVAAWLYLIGRFDLDPGGNSLDICVNGVWRKVATAAASIFNSTADLTIAAEHGGTSLLTGRCAAAFLCAAAASDAMVGGVFQATRAIFGV